MVMKNWMFVFILMVLFHACGGHAETAFTFSLPLDDERIVVLETASERIPLTLERGDSLRTTSFALALNGGEYARIWVGDFAFTVWLEDGNPWTTKLKWNELHFEGAGADINNYLNRRWMHEIYFRDYYVMSEAAYLERLEQVVQEREKILRERDLDPNYTAREMKRIHWLRGYYLAQMASRVDERAEKIVLSEKYLGELKEVAKEETVCWGIPEYPEAIKRALFALAGEEEKTSDAVGRMQRVLKLATENYKDKRLVEYIVHKSVMEYAGQKGLDGASELDRVHRACVERNDYVMAYEKMYDVCKKLFKGQPAISFTFQDTTGNEVSLSDFMGKYVYIDIWATWCGPCNAELPYLAKLEKALEGKNICFVGISCDFELENWKAFVKEEKLGGVQVYMNGDKEFMNAVLCNSVPRFMLIDREGKYIDANMTRPSNPETLKTLEALPGI